MKYKALMLDLDGTTIPNYKDSIPSQRVIAAIQKAREIIHVGIATSRPTFELKNILKYINFSGPSVINAGSQIIDYPSGTILATYALGQKDVSYIISLITKNNFAFVLQDGKKNFIHKTGIIYEDILQIWIKAQSEEIVDTFIQTISHISTIFVHKIPSWNKGKFDTVITNAKATKQYGIFEIAQILGIETHEIIGIGDGYNDFPLLMACGLKVAMGNAVPELKAIADYIAPPVEEDGVADVIEKFILS